MPIPVRDETAHNEAMTEGHVSKNPDDRDPSRPDPKAPKPSDPTTTDPGASRQSRQSAAGHGSGEAETPRSGRILVMNHGGDQLQGLCDALTRVGHSVQIGESLAHSHRLVQDERPDLVILNPLVLCSGGVELELIETLQREDDPIPLILIVDDLEALADARQMRIPFRDFLLEPFSPAECVHRLELALANRSRFRGLRSRARMLEDQVSIDFKTGLTSDRYFRRILELEWKRAQRHHNPLSLLLIDVDDFKSINDSTEYEFGDEVLRRIASSLKDNIRETDFAARFGGDEFCVLLPQTSPAEAVQTALRICDRIASTVVQSGDYERRATVSIGIDSYDGRTASNLDTLRRNANRALQDSKRRGKNQVWLYSEGHADAAAADRPQASRKPNEKAAEGPRPGEASPTPPGPTTSEASE